MMNETAIGWTDLSWNVWSGCKKTSTGCAHCYADQLAEQRRGTLAFPHGFDLTLRPKNLLDPPRALKKHGPSIIFCESMSDVGLDDDELSPDELDRLSAAGFAGMDHVRDGLFTAISETPEHRYQILTKRPENLVRYLRSRGVTGPDGGDRAVRAALASCWIGTTIEHSSTVKRLDTLRALRQTVPVLFVSAEPLLAHLAPALVMGNGLAGIDWLIIGGESGTHVSDPRNAGRFLVDQRHGKSKGWQPKIDRIEWIRGLRGAAHAAGARVWFKQWGGPTPASGGRLLDGRTYDELPDHVPGAMPPGRRERGAATAALARKLPVQP